MKKKKVLYTIINSLLLIGICVSSFLFAKYMVRRGIDETPIDTSERRIK